MGGFDVKASFVTFDRKRELNDLLAPLSRLGIDARIAETSAGKCIEWTESIFNEPLSNDWCIAEPWSIKTTARTFISRTRDSWTAISISPSEASVLAAQESLARWADGHALDIEVPLGEFFGKMAERFYSFEDFAMRQRPSVAFGGILFAAGDITMSLDLGAQVVSDWEKFWGEVTSSWLKLDPSMKFKAAYLAINGVPTNVFGNGTAILDIDDVAGALHVAESLAVLFDFQLMPA